MAETELLLCNTSELCTNMGCKGEVIAVCASVAGEIATKLRVRCETAGFTKDSETIEGLDPTTIVEDYKDGVDPTIIEVLMAVEGVVCCTNGPEDITNPNILYNGKTVAWL